MKRVFVALGILFLVSPLAAQVKLKEKKYPSLLWEITGNGLKKPSYLIGTMHVSSKMAFHLPDSFYIALRSAGVVALETNPETWQDDMNKYEISSGYSLAGLNYGIAMRGLNDFLSINTLKVGKYEGKIERALYSNPSVINSLLYRTYGNDASDFEEDTYLDMYIYQCGRKLGKKVAGVEDYGESMKLMAEAYKDAAKEKKKKEKSYEDAEDYSPEKLQEAYRNGNLDLLDTINKFNSTSDAFDEKFLYRRNEIQAGSIDSIIKSGSTLFVGVGAAHLPGNRGVIELLRKKGYKLRPVKMGERDSKDKELLDKVRVPVTFKTTFADDSLFRADIPGKFYKSDERALFTITPGDERQYADMANGSYYMVNRIVTNAWMWGHNTDVVYKKVDSLLYENIPGKIVSRTNFTRNGFKGIDLTNRTRRGDLQRYNIYITPFEVIIFKMSGNGDYVKNGEEANKFFSSIQFKEYKNGAEASVTGWKKFSPPTGGFAISLPHEPFVNHTDNWYYDAEDKTTQQQYRIIRTDIHNLDFVEADTFDLGLLNETFMASEFIDSQYYNKQHTFKGYPALDGKYRDKSGNVYLTRFLIQGPHYYTLVAHGKQETPAMQEFLNSFEIKPFIYREPKLQKDTSLYFSVTTPVFPESKKIKLDMPQFSYLYSGSREDELSEADQLENGVYRTKIISNDTTGEKVYVSFSKQSRYTYEEDSIARESDNDFPYADSTCIFKFKKRTTWPNKTEVLESMATDTGSSRTVWAKSFYKNGLRFVIATEADSLTAPSAFLKRFFDSFTPADTLKGVNPYTKKSNLFFDDFMSKDSVLHKRAVAGIGDIDLDSTDLPRMKKAIQSLTWDEKKYLDTKKEMINKLGDIPAKESADYLKELYYALDDTVSIQYPVLENLLQHKTAYSYNIFRNIIGSEPPVKENVYGYDYDRYDYTGDGSSGGYDNGDFMDELTDSLKLTKTILPDLLPLLNLDDYKDDVMKLLGQMVDSSVVQPADYENYFSKFLLEARQELKKQSIAEKKKAIEKAEADKEKNEMEDDMASADRSGDAEKGEGNDDLSLYASLLIPFWDTKPAVQPLLQQMLKSNDKRLKYNTMLLLIRHNKSFPDTMLSYFGKMEEFRYELYKDLKDINRLDKFPALYNNHLDLAKSKLITEKDYGKPDSLVFIKRLPAEYKAQKGFIYFFKYKDQKVEQSWKLASVGLVPEAPGEFEFADSLYKNTGSFLGSNAYLYGEGNASGFDFTKFTDTKIKEDEPLDKQLDVALKKLLYARRKSASEFYQDEDSRYSSLMDSVRIRD